MASSPVILDATVLAEWLEKKAPSVWWFLDGEREVSASQALPAQGEDLARAFRRHGGRLAVVEEPPIPTGRGEIVDIQALDELLERQDDERALELAWLANGQPGEPWLLVESIVNEDAKALPSEAWRA